MSISLPRLRRRNDCGWRCWYRNMRAVRRWRSRAASPRARTDAACCRRSPATRARRHCTASSCRISAVTCRSPRAKQQRRQRHALARRPQAGPPEQPAERPLPSRGARQIYPMSHRLTRQHRAIAATAKRLTAFQQYGKSAVYTAPGESPQRRPGGADPVPGREHGLLSLPASVIGTPVMLRDGRKQCCADSANGGMGKSGQWPSAPQATNTSNC